MVLRLPFERLWGSLVPSGVTLGFQDALNIFAMHWGSFLVTLGLLGGSLELAFGGSGRSLRLPFGGL